MFPKKQPGNKQENMHKKQKEQGKDGEVSSNQARKNARKLVINYAGKQARKVAKDYGGKYP